MPTHEAFLGALPFTIKGTQAPVPRRRNPAQGSSINDRFSRLFRHRTPRAAHKPEAQDAWADRGCVSEFETQYLQQRSTELLLKNDCALARLLCRLEISGDRAATMASHLVSFLRGNPHTADSVEDFVTGAFDVHVACYSALAANPRNVLRDNNLATMIVVCYLQQTCRSYLVSILQPVMTAIEPFVESCELDPMRLPQGHSVGTTSRNSYNLYCVCRTVLDAVFSAGRHAPAAMRSLCTFIRLRIEAAWDLPELRPDTPSAAPTGHASRARPAGFVLGQPRPPATAKSKQPDDEQQPILELQEWENDLKSTVQVDIMNDIKTALDSWLAKPDSAALDAGADMFASPGPQAGKSHDDDYNCETRRSITNLMASTLGATDTLDMTLSIRGDKRAKAREGLRLSQIKDTWRQTQSPRKPASPTASTQAGKHASRRISGSYFSPTETVISMLIFVRFFIPILTSPEAYGLVDARMSPDSRRGLLLCAKVLAVLCNGLSFGSKETYLIPMNGLIREYRPKLRRFLHAISSGAALQSAPRDDGEGHHSSGSDDDDRSDDDGGSDASDSVTLDELASQFQVVSVGAKIGTNEEQRKSRMSLAHAVLAAAGGAGGSGSFASAQDAHSAEEIPPVPLMLQPPSAPSRSRHMRQTSKSSMKSPAVVAAIQASQPSRKTFDLPTRQAMPPSPKLLPQPAAAAAAASSAADRLPDSEAVDESLVTIDFLSCLESNFGKLEGLVGDKTPADLQQQKAHLQAACHELKPIVHYAKHLASSTRARARSDASHRLSDEYEDLGRLRGGAGQKSHAAN